MLKLGVGAAIVGLLFGPAVVFVGLSTMLNPAARAACLPPAVAAGQVPDQLDVRLRDGTHVTLNHSQLTLAATIVTTGIETDDVGDDGIVVALMAALTESTLRMLSNGAAYPESTRYTNDGDGSDGDSLGMFQMRPSAGWGTVDQLMDPTYQARAFFGGRSGPNRGSPRGLLDVDGWRQLDPGAAAQAVEVSAYPDRYANAEPAAKAILAALTTRRFTPASNGRDGRVESEGRGQSGTGRRLAEMPTIHAQPGGPVIGPVTTANANLKFPQRTSAALRTIADAAAPDFITLNEIHSFTATGLERALPGYGSYKDPVPVGGGDPVQSVNNAIMWRKDAWRLLDGGRVKIVEDDRAIFHGKQVRWDRFAIWGVFEHVTDGATVAVVATHHMTNVKSMPAQWGDPPLTRRQQYDLGMDILIELTGVLAPYGPVLLGGDLNSFPDDGPFAAAPRMTAAGFAHTRDRAVMYQFFPSTIAVAGHRQLIVPSDHPANVTTLAMNGANTEAGLPTGPGGECSPCPSRDGIPQLPGAPQSNGAADYNLGPVSPVLRQLVEILAPLFGIRSVGGYRESARDPEGHPSGNAADFMVPTGPTGWATAGGRLTGDALAAYAQAHAAELQIDYIIWRQRIWSVARADEGWRPMASRGSPTQNHEDHVHINVVPGGTPGTVGGCGLERTSVP